MYTPTHTQTQRGVMGSPMTLMKIPHPGASEAARAPALTELEERRCRFGGEAGEASRRNREAPIPLGRAEMESSQNYQYHFEVHLRWIILCLNFKYGAIILVVVKPLRNT